MNQKEKFIELIDRVGYDLDSISLYNELSNLLNETNNNKLTSEILFARASLDCSFIHKYEKQSIEDFLIVSKLNRKRKADSFAFLSFLYETINEIPLSIEYGEKALESKTKLESDVYFTLARCYLKSDEENSPNLAINYIDKYLSFVSEDDQNVETLNLMKADAFITMLDFKKAHKILDKLMISSTTKSLYFVRARAYSVEYSQSKNKDIKLLHDAIESLKIYLKYVDDDMEAFDFLEELLILDDKYEEALTLLEKKATFLSEEELLLNKLKLCNLSDKFEEGLKFIRSYKDYEKNWKLVYAEGDMLAKQGKYEKGLSCFLKAFEMNKELFIALDIALIYSLLNKVQEAYDFLKKYKDHFDTKEVYEKMFDYSLVLDVPYEEVSELLDKLLLTNAISIFEYIDGISDFTLTTDSLTSYIKNNIIKNYPLLNVNQKKKLAIRYAYGENGIKQNLKKAYSILNELLEEFPNDTCFLSILGRTYQIDNRYEDASKILKKGYLIFKENDSIYCDCIIGNYAYQLIIENNVEKAKEIIIETVSKFGAYTSSNCRLLYTYFALNYEDGFNIEKAKELLSLNCEFYRYDITRITYLKKIEQITNKKDPRLDYLMENFEIAFNKEEKQYYENSINYNISLPFWKNI